MRTTTSLKIIVFVLAIAVFVLFNWNKPNSEIHTGAERQKDTTNMDQIVLIDGRTIQIEKKNTQPKKPKTVQEELRELFKKIDSVYIKNSQGATAVQTDTGTVMQEWYQKVNYLSDSVYEDISILSDYTSDSLKQYKIFYQLVDERGNMVRRTFNDFSIKNKKDTIGFKINYAEYAEYPDSLARPFDDQKKALSLETRDVITMLRKIIQ